MHLRVLHSSFNGVAVALILVLYCNAHRPEEQSEQSSADVAVTMRPSCSQLMKNRHYSGTPLPQTPASVTRFRAGTWNVPLKQQQRQQQAQLYGKKREHFIHIPKTGGTTVERLLNIKLALPRKAREDYPFSVAAPHKDSGGKNTLFDFMVQTQFTCRGRSWKNQDGKCLWWHMPPRYWVSANETENTPDRVGKGWLWKDIPTFCKCHPNP